MISKRIKVKELIANSRPGAHVIVMGWVRTFRNNQFISLNDGSSNTNVQVVAELGKFDEILLKRITTGAALKVTGEVVASLGKGQNIEVKADSLEILGDSDAEKFPLQPKKHSLEFLREVAHLRFRTNTFGSVFRVRHGLAFAIHKFFNDKGFIYLHTPIITATDAEGAGELFHVTNFDLANPKINEDPTFRAENSNTTRHLAEFWMIEPEMAFADLEDDANLAEEFIKYIIGFALDNNREDLDFLSARLQEEEKQKPLADRSEMDLIGKLEFVIKNNFERLSYTEAIEILRDSNHNKKKKFQYLIDKWGVDLQSEHERYLVEKHFKKPVILTNYPKEIKAFYMRQNDDGKTVAAMDILTPGIGEIVGGSQREERLDKLKERMNEMNIPTEELSWYLDTRRFGTCPHAGFGLGFERLVQFVTGMTNIRDVIPVARTPKSAEF